MDDRLAHVPGGRTLPVVGHTLSFVRDARGLVERHRRRHGDVFRMTVLGRRSVVFLTPQATKEIYLDPTRSLSSEAGWQTSIGPLFQRGLMLRDFDDHRLHRRAMQQAFGRAALTRYVERIHEVVDRTLDGLGAGEVEVYLLMKRLTLDIAAEVFVGAPLGPASRAVNEAFVAMVAASITPLRADLPGTGYRRGLAARRRLVAIIGELVARRRAEGAGGSDLLSRLCAVTTETGEPLADDEVVDHVVFVLLAAHDTTTSTLAVMLWELAHDAAWQTRVAEEVRALDGAEVTLDNHAGLVDTTRVMNEAMRLSPAVPFSPRVAVRDVVVDGWPIPAGESVTAASMALHRHPDWWSEPDRFDPDRFSPERAEDRRHSHLFVPFGGGAHLCIGNHVAELVTKTVVARLLARYRMTADPRRRVVVAPVPIPKPRSRMLLTLG